MRDQNTRVLEPFPSFYVFLFLPKKKKKNKGVGSVRLEEGRTFFSFLFEPLCPTSLIEKREMHRRLIKTEAQQLTSHTFLGLLAKIKCSICSYQFNI